ncbi:PRA1 family protein [Rhynchospora pubera]|uniref:PRA1 family protein n=1 Tax=Rhynchospora pubera TaxID=906938 RepID=A0AAV8EV03_9POAL|nr:PRA1 family protein [Rhynchospora pubera]
MVTGGAIRRSAAAAMDRVYAEVRMTRRAVIRFAPRPGAFGFPPDAESGAVRIVRNIRTFKIHYAAILWMFLLASLFPHHRPSMLLLMASSKAILCYAVLLKAFPSSTILRRVLDRRLVAVVFIIVVVGELVATRAVESLKMAAYVGLPVVVLHALLRIRDDLLIAEEADANGDEVAASAVVEKEKEREKREDGGVDLEAVSHGD